MLRPLCYSEMTSCHFFRIIKKNRARGGRIAENIKDSIPDGHKDTFYRKKWPIYRKEDLPFVAKRLVKRYGLEHGMRSISQIQHALGYSRLYRRVLESPLIYSLVPIERLYGQIMEELEEEVKQSK